MNNEIDAFGNAVGNAVVAGRVEANKPKQKPIDKILNPEQPMHSPVDAWDPQEAYRQNQQQAVDLDREVDTPLTSFDATPDSKKVEPKPPIDFDIDTSANIQKELGDAGIHGYKHFMPKEVSQTDLMVDAIFDEPFNSDLLSVVTEVDLGAGDSATGEFYSNLQLLAGANSVSSLAIGTGLLLANSNASYINNDWFNHLSSREVIPVKHMGTPQYSAKSTQLVSGLSWALESNQLSVVPNIDYGKISDITGKGLSVTGALLSWESARQSINANPGNDTVLYTEVGKASVDTAAAFTAFGKFARFSPAALVYTGADLVVQFSPDYMVKYGEHAGQKVSGWSKFAHAEADHYQQTAGNDLKQQGEYINRRQNVGPMF